jgi:hypothetical protein
LACGRGGGGGLDVEHQQGLFAVKRMRPGCRIVSVGCAANPAMRMTLDIKRSCVSFWAQKCLQSVNNDEFLSNKVLLK